MSTLARFWNAYAHFVVNLQAAIVIALVLEGAITRWLLR